MTRNSDHSLIASTTRSAVEREVTGLTACEKRKAFLLAASELVAAAADAISAEKPGIPVVELIFLSERIASLAEGGDGLSSDN